MRHRQPALFNHRYSYPPRLWLMTDERMGEALLSAIDRLPIGKAGIVFRHYSLAPNKRRALFDKVKQRAQKRRLILLLAGSEAMAHAWRADGWHGPSAARLPQGRRLLHSMAVHNPAELQRAKRANADLIFVSPVFSTRSHIGEKTLGRFGFARLARPHNIPAIALGGMSAYRAYSLKGLGAYGYAAIDDWLRQTPSWPAVR